MPSKLPRKPAKKAKKPGLGRKDPEGLAAAAGKNRERVNRFWIIDGFRRLKIPYAQWPDFVQAFYTDPQQQIEYHQSMIPPPFQAPEFDRLNQSPEDWVKVADRAWKQHRDRFLQQ